MGVRGRNSINRTFIEEEEEKRLILSNWDRVTFVACIMYTQHLSA